MKRSDEQDDATRIGSPPDPGQKIPGRVQASLVIVDGRPRGMEYPVTKAYTVIGRDSASDIVPGDPHISRQHAVIVYHAGSYLLRDLDSTNGTFMNGASIKQTHLQHGDKFRVGSTTFQFILQEDPRAATYEIG